MSEDSAVKLKPFRGREEDWMFWAPIFMAHADVKRDNEVPNNNEVLDPNAN